MNILYISKIAYIHVLIHLVKATSKILAIPKHGDEKLLNLPRSLVLRSSGPYVPCPTCEECKIWMYSTSHSFPIWWTHHLYNISSVVSCSSVRSLYHPSPHSTVWERWGTQWYIWVGTSTEEHPDFDCQGESHLWHERQKNTRLSISLIVTTDTYSPITLLL